MTSRRFTLRQKAAALVPVLLLLVYVPAQMMLRCRIDGLLRAECCCSQKSEEQPSGPTIKAEDCCDQEIANVERPKVDVARSETRELAPSAVAVVLPTLLPVSLLLLLLPASHRFERAALRRGPAREGPPLILLKQAFLI